MKSSTITQEKIKSTFIKLIEAIPLKNITVTMLVKESGLSRGSFYKYYNDIPCLIEEILKEQISEIVKKFEADNSFDSALFGLFVFASERKQMLYNICNSSNRLLFEHYLWRFFQNATSIIIKAGANGRSISAVHLDQLIEYYTGSIFAATLHWISTGMKDSLEEMMEKRTFLNAMQLSVNEDLFDRCERLNLEEKFKGLQH